jgi:hypothetical protein
MTIAVVRIRDDALRDALALRALGDGRDLTGLKGVKDVTNMPAVPGLRALGITLPERDGLVAILCTVTNRGSRPVIIVGIEAERPVLISEKLLDESTVQAAGVSNIRVDELLGAGDLTWFRVFSSEPTPLVVTWFDGVEQNRTHVTVLPR